MPKDNRAQGIQSDIQGIWAKISCGLWNVAAKGVPEVKREITLNQLYKGELQWPV